MGVEATDLIAEAIEITGSVSALARQLQLGPNGSSMISHWKRGDQAPNFQNTVRLLEICGWLSPKKQRPARTQNGHPVGLEAKVDALQQGQVEMLETLQSLRAAVESYWRRRGSG